MFIRERDLEVGMDYVRREKEAGLDLEAWMWVIDRGKVGGHVEEGCRKKRSRKLYYVAYVDGNEKTFSCGLLLPVFRKFVPNTPAFFESQWS